MLLCVAGRWPVLKLPRQHVLLNQLLKACVPRVTRVPRDCRCVCAPRAGDQKCDSDSPTPPTPPTPPSIEAAVQAAMARQGIEDAESEDGPFDSDSPLETDDAAATSGIGSQVLNMQREPRGTYSSVLNPTTVFVGFFCIVKREDRAARMCSVAVCVQCGCLSHRRRLMSMVAAAWCQVAKELFYVKCPLHSYAQEETDANGRKTIVKRSCGKSMQLNQPSETVVLHRLFWWIFQGPASNYGCISGWLMEVFASEPLFVSHV